MLDVVMIAKQYCERIIKSCINWFYWK